MTPIDHEQIGRLAESALQDLQDHNPPGNDQEGYPLVADAAGNVHIEQGYAGELGRLLVEHLERYGWVVCR